MRIAASQDLGQVGFSEEGSVVYNWKWYHNVSGVSLWIVLFLALVLVKANRNRRAWLILIPVLAVNLFWIVFKMVLGFASSQTAMLEQMFVSLTVGISLLWLLGHKIGNRNRFVTFLLALVIMTLVNVDGSLSYLGFAILQNSPVDAIFLTILMQVMLPGLVLTGWKCRKRYSGVRFMLWLAVWNIGASIALLLVYFGVAMIFMSISGQLASMWMLLQVFVAGLVLGGFLYAVMFGYMILALRSGFFRERFYGCMGLKSMGIPSSLDTTTSQGGVQSCEVDTHKDDDFT